MLRRLDYLLDKLLIRLERNGLLRKIARKCLLSYYGRKGLSRFYIFYQELQLEKDEEAFRRRYNFERPLDMPPNHVIDVEIAKKDLLDIKRILDKAGIRFWLMFGTFLGAYRDKALIPYDEDTDLAIYAEDIPALARCKQALAKEGFHVGANAMAVILQRYGEHTDIHRLELSGNKRVWIGTSTEYDSSAFETFNEIEFLGQNWRILSEPERWLKYTYGEDWKTPMKGKHLDGTQPYGRKFESP